VKDVLRVPWLQRVASRNGTSPQAWVQFGGLR